MVGQIYPSELQLTKANASFSNLNLSITNAIVSSNNDAKHGALNSEIVNLQF